MPRSHLTYGGENPFLYPEFLLRKTASFSGYKFEDYQALPGPEQSRLFAFYELSLIEDRLLAGGIHGG
jgi:hypothetical protein